MDTIEHARQVMEAADDAYESALNAGASHDTLNTLAQAVHDTEQAYYRACEFWEPAF
jgi:hypothetical protein